MSHGSRELIVVLADDYQLPPDPAEVRSALSHWGLSVQPLFAGWKDKYVLDEDKAKRLADERLRFVGVDAPDEQLDAIGAALRERPEVASAYVKPAIRLPEFPMTPAGDRTEIGRMLVQPYLGEASKGGIEASWTHTQPGGKGDDICLADLEWNWDLQHEDLRDTAHDFLFGTATVVATDHGTAILGIMGAHDNGIGITGIAPAATIQVAVFEQGKKTSSTIAAVAGKLGRGNIMVIPFERPGPAYNPKKPKLGGIPLEWWDDDRVAIDSAVNAGIIVVAAAGNGKQDLDNTIYDTPAGNPSGSWKNPFRRGAGDIGSILVGAGAPPANLYGINWGLELSRIPESNHGDCVDAQGWGYDIATLGFGDRLFVKNATKQQFYTVGFGMTSGATAMVAGALACAQGFRRNQTKTLWDSFEARKALHETGMPQAWGPLHARTDRIGNRPNLKELLARP